MGTPGAKHTEPRTPRDLQRIAGILGTQARLLNDVAERMLRAGVRNVAPLNARGVDTFLRKLRKFTLDADEKAVQKGAKPAD